MTIKETLTEPQKKTVEDLTPGEASAVTYFARAHANIFKGAYTKPGDWDKTYAQELDRLINHGDMKSIMERYDTVQRNMYPGMIPSRGSTRS